MFIKSLTIKNFRCFGKGVKDKGTEIELNEKGITAFVGRNGSGKTAVLEALDYLIGQDYLTTKISEKDFHCEANDIKDQIIIEGETRKPFFFEVDVITDQTNRAEKIIIPCKTIRLIIKRREKAENVLDNPFIITKTVIPMDGSIDEEIYGSADFKKSYKIVSLSETEEQNLDIDSAKAMIADLLKGEAVDIKCHKRYCDIEFKLKSSNKNRTASFPVYSLNFNPNRIRNLAKSYYLTKNRDNDVSGDYSLISKILTDLHWKYKRKEFKNEETSIPEQYNILSESLRNIIDEKNVLIKEINNEINKISSEDKDFQFDFIDIEQPYQSAFISKNETGKILLPDNLGSGFNILIAYALFSYIANKEKTPIVLIIDEPELHLHNDWEKKMYDTFVEQTNLQIVYATHSPYFIGPDLIGNVFRFENQPKQEMEIYKISEPEKVKDLFHLENREIFFARKVLLVEGFADRIRFRKFLEKYDIQDFFVIQGLKYKGVSEKICNDLNIPFKIIVDLDCLSDEFPPDLNEDELQKIIEYKELEKILPSIKMQNEILEKFLREKILPKILKTTDQDGNKIKLCPSSKMIVKMEKDGDYKKRVEEKIKELKSKNTFVLNYGMLENYLDENGSVKNDDGKKDEKEKELKNIFEIK